MEFEWDPLKNRANEKKHGISFERAIVIWEGKHLEIGDLVRSDDGETRSATMGLVDDKICVAIWTRRGEKIRLISVRRARKNEKKVFFEKIQDRG